MRYSLTTIMLFSMLTGCLTGTTGENGNFTFYDQTKTPEFWQTDRKIDAPVATGASLAIQIKKTSNFKLVQSLESVDFSPMLCKKTGFDSGILEIKANAAGATKMTVKADGLTDTLGLTIKEPAKQSIEPRPWHNLYLKPLIFPKGVVVQQGSKFWLFGWQIDAKGDSLTGYGADKWVVDGDTFTYKTEPYSDYLELTAIKDGESTMKFGKATYKLWSGQETIVKTMSFYDALAEEAGSVFEIKYGSPTIIYMALYDADKRLIVGELSSMPEFKSSDDSIVKLSVPTEKDLKNKASGISLNYSRVVLVQCQAETGSAVVTVSWSGLKEEFTVNCMKNQK